MATVDEPSLMSAGDEQYNTGHDEDDAAPESCAHAAPRNLPAVSRLQLTHHDTGLPHQRRPSSASALSGSHYIYRCVIVSVGVLGLQQDTV